MRTRDIDSVIFPIVSATLNPPKSAFSCNLNWLFILCMCIFLEFAVIDRQYKDSGKGDSPPVVTLSIVSLVSVSYLADKTCE